MIKDDLEKLFNKTHNFRNGCDFNKTFSQYGDHTGSWHGTAFEAFYHCIEADFESQFNWKVRMLSCDGGVKQFQLFYESKGLLILVSEMYWQEHIESEWLFSPDLICSFLSKSEKHINSLLNGK